MLPGDSAAMAVMALPPEPKIRFHRGRAHNSRYTPPATSTLVPLDEDGAIGGADVSDGGDIDVALLHAANELR